jgi:hypothetical protein
MSDKKTKEKEAPETITDSPVSVESTTVEEVTIPEEESTPVEEVETPIDVTSDAVVSEDEKNNEAVAVENTPAAKVTEDEDAPAAKATADEEEIESSDDEHKDEAETEHNEELDYNSLSKQELIAALGDLIKSKPISDIKNVVEEIKSEFNSKFSEEVAQKKEEFLAEGGNIIDFHYSTPLKKEFNSLYFDYKEKRNAHYRDLKKDLQANLEKRLELVEELKGLLNAEENINTTYKHFKDIQTKWFEAGAIPRDKYNTVWNTYHHHVENFYDFLHLNREFRDLDFKHNLEQKLKLISRAEELAGEENINKAFRELQMLHKMWKEEVGPVAKEFRDEVWDKFSAATKIVHDKRQDLHAEEEKKFESNFETKMALIAEINTVSAETKSSHQAWQEAIKKLQVLRDRYFETGKVPRAMNKATWGGFKEATRDFNKVKNAFYKDQKKEQFTNLEKKRALIEIAESNKDVEDFEATTAVMKKVQHDWKQIGHVPRKDSDKIWKQFKAACNHYFDRAHAQKNEANKEEIANLDAKSEFLDAFNAMTLSGDHKEDIKEIKERIATWKALGRVPYNKRNIDQKFNKALDAAFGRLDLGKKETELIKFENKISAMVSQEDERKLQNEQYFITKKIEETKAEINQLENNLGFFQHVPDDNPMVMEVNKNITGHKEQLEVWKAKLIKIKSMR